MDNLEALMRVNREDNFCRYIDQELREEIAAHRRTRRDRNTLIVLCAIQSLAMAIGISLFLAK